MEASRRPRPRGPASHRPRPEATPPVWTYLGDLLLLFLDVADDLQDSLGVGGARRLLGEPVHLGDLVSGLGEGDASDLIPSTAHTCTGIFTSCLYMSSFFLASSEDTRSFSCKLLISESFLEDSS